MSKYVQTTQSKVNHHIYPSGCQIIKAFTANDFACYDKSKCQLQVIDDSSFNIVGSVRITWCIQKSCQNGQTIALSSDSTNPNLCPVIRTLRMVLRARRLKQPNSMPLMRCRTKKTPMLNMAANRMATLIQEAVKKVCPRISAEDLIKYSAHLL